MGTVQQETCRRRDWTLTERESRFAEAHMDIVWWYLNRRGLSCDEWYDVVVIRYLQAVKRWYNEPGLRAYSFATIAAAAMRSAVSSEYRARSRRPRTVSLYDTLPGTEGLTYADIL